jgi:hypothetical protein
VVGADTAPTWPSGRAAGEVVPFDQDHVPSAPGETPGHRAANDAPADYDELSQPLTFPQFVSPPLFAPRITGSLMNRSGRHLASSAPGRPVVTSWVTSLPQVGAHPTPPCETTT